ncbi:MAG TPA: hypothetical protein DCK95_08840 [Anaerolineaceae bacterium]|nr:hypothetical protein [Anaerolineaceae bacterium]HCC86237.1 hypothetical protein [Porphyromonadaceae bacterium]
MPGGVQSMMRFTSFLPLTFRTIKKCNIMEKIIIAQLIAHIVADFFAQPASVSFRKQRGAASWHLFVYSHISCLLNVSQPKLNL